MNKLPLGLCGNREDHEPHEHQSESLGLFWCDADQERRQPYASEKRWRGQPRNKGEDDAGLVGR
jgi:hypothetical protein